METNELILRVRECMSELGEEETRHKTSMDELVLALNKHALSASKTDEAERKEVARLLYWTHKDIPASLIFRSMHCKITDMETELEIPCGHCGRCIVGKYSVNSRLYYAKLRSGLLCESCQNARVDMECRRIDKEGERHQELLNGNYKEHQTERLEILCGLSRRNPHSFDRIKNLPYHEFLQTNYWCIVREYALMQQGDKCVLCSSNKSVNVHHKTYAHHGSEHEHIEDLVVVCKKCHAKFHDKFVN